MKKFICGLSMALLTVILALAFTGCNTDGKIKDAFEKEGFTVTSTTVDDNETAKKFLSALLTSEEMESTKGYAVITVNKVLRVGVIIQFPSTDKLKETLNKNDDNAYNNAREKGFVNGNCYLISSDSSIIEIFKNA